ncbi:UDP-2,4-diacetamido-2,4,6-trideoxy-beta-L-altropyranose hydrolase [Escherichia coli]|uniref:UDP-2,4-diacetamido-2,4, 6-trideoxy-beta-L-altropyranose hydrolase n=1 Tax=Escherichia coli TaxID=562 RepID=UPI00234DB6E5|nr:UDP-2,4-diacetamido-2,4,6-trideoxy-beta-L-altropyranose hydrolase [Escherichia coli]MDC6993012.1 UDP-2,4-diacetamido-2,4,6-trideoxy-beta-L-altropyranose hydrolase [Escherichia coli]
MKVFLRVDSSLSIGSGHIIRCLNLAIALRNVGAECIFISKKHRGNILFKIEQAEFLYQVIPTPEEYDIYVSEEKYWLNGSQNDDALQFSLLIKKQCENPDIIIVDHYSLDYEWELIIKRNFPKAKLIVIDDLCNRPHCCDLLIDQTYLRHEKEYTCLNIWGGKILTGPKYALLDPVFSKLREQSINRKTQLEFPQRLMITMGGVDVNNITGKVLRYIENKNLKSIEKITVILGSACPHREEIEALVADSKYPINILTNVENMAELMLEHDFAIGAMGGTTWERCVMALPAVNIAIANNQSTIATNFSKAGAIVLHSDNFTKNDFYNAFNRLITDYHQQRDLVMSICDGQGLIRDIQEIIPCFSTDGINVTLRFATLDDINFVYQLQCEPQTRKFARNPNIPSYDSHTEWMRRKLVEQNSFFYIIEHIGACGVLRLDPIEHELAQYEISIFLTTASMGKGIAKAAIRRATMLHKDTVILATVLYENFASHRLFEQIGFNKISSCEYINRGGNE